MGGKIMRVDQLAAMARSHLSDRYNFEVALLPKSSQPWKCKKFIEFCKDAIVILHKNAAANLGPEYREALNKVAAGICLDHLDVVAGPFETGFVDVHLAASYESERLLYQNLQLLHPVPGTQVRHLRHHADPRLKPNTISSNQLLLGYFGLASNVTMPQEIADSAIIPTYDGKSNVDDLIAGISKANLHICTRDSLKGFAAKPFTKGFNAAVVGANVLVNRQVHDAEYYLGSNYPYIVESTDTDEIYEGISRAKTDYGGANWKMALKQMENVSRQIAPKEVMAELDLILRLFA